MSSNLQPYPLHWETYCNDTHRGPIDADIRATPRQHWAVATALLLAFLCAVFSGAALAKPEQDFSWGQRQNYISCAIISSEYLTGLQLYHKGLPLQVAQKHLPNISQEAKERLARVYALATSQGVLNSYADINTNFARCATLVNKTQGRPVIGDPQYGYYFCSGENKVRFEMLLQINRNLSAQTLFSLFPENRKAVLAHYISLIEQSGLLAAFELTANNLKRCLQNIQ